MIEAPTIWGIHMQWDDSANRSDLNEIAIGWKDIGDLTNLSASRDVFKTAYAKAFDGEKPGAIPVKAGVLFRFSKEIKAGDVIVYPSKPDRMVNIGIIAGPYRYEPYENYPHRLPVEWKTKLPRTQFSQSALYEMGSAITLFQISNNSDEIIAALNGLPFTSVDAPTSAIEIATQADESVEDFIIRRLKNDITPEQFEHFIAGLMRSMGYFARTSRHTGDGGVDVIAHRDELGFEPPIVKVQCKQMLGKIGGPDVQRLLGAIQTGEHALFVTLGDYSIDAVRIERGKSNLRLINGTDLVQLILNNYENLESSFQAIIPLKRSYAPSAVNSNAT